MKNLFVFCILVIICSCIRRAACAGNESTPTYPNPTVTPLNYTHDGVDLQGFYSIPEGGQAPYPVVVIIPDWDGVNFYEQARATMFSLDEGWIGFAADIYGADLHNVSDMQQRIELATLYRSNASLFTARIQAAVDTVKSIENVDTTRIALVGYCFGGSGVLLYSLESAATDVKGIVSIHGGLTPAILNDTQAEVKSKVLVLSGGDDDASGDIMTLESTLNSTAGSWEITRFSGIKHAWTVWMGENYDAWADNRTWVSSVQFLKEVFAEITYDSLEPDQFQTEDVIYTDLDGNQYQGYVSIPDKSIWKYPTPGVLILPDWDGVNEYEKKRATLLAKDGYVAFAADIFGKDLQGVANISQRIELITKYNTNSTLYIDHIDRALTAFIDGYGGAVLDVGSLAIIGYCFGGTGVIQYIFNGGDAAKAVVAYHGGLQTLPPIVKNISAFVLIESGGDDAAHGNQTVLEEALNGAGASWEISRYSGVVHGFTVWNNTDAYSPVADFRSWTAMMAIFGKLLDGPSQLSNNDTDTNSTTVPPNDGTTNGTTSPTNDTNNSSGSGASSGANMVYSGNAVMSLIQLSIPIAICLCILL